MTVRAKGWLIFYSHDVSERPSAFGVPPELLAFSVSAAKAAGCRVVTVASGLQAATGGNDTQSRIGNSSYNLDPNGNAQAN
jgi:hypothetical protein